MRYDLLSTNYKFERTYLGGHAYTRGLQLQPHMTTFDDGRNVNLCPYAGECVVSCLQHSGRNVFMNAERARLMRTWLYADNLKAFTDLLTSDITKMYIEHGTYAWVRLNTLSDVMWERRLGPDWFKKWEGKIGGFYDYTKFPYRHRYNMPDNYHLTYSFSEKTDDREFFDNIANGRNVAVTFFVCRNDHKLECRHKCVCPLPPTFKGIPVIDGDLHDHRPIDPPNRVVGLRLKQPREGGGIRWQEVVARATQARDKGEPSFVQIPN